MLFLLKPWNPSLQEDRPLSVNYKSSETFKQHPHSYGDRHWTNLNL